MSTELILYPFDRPVQEWRDHFGTAGLRLSQHYDFFAQIDQSAVGKRPGIKQVCTPKPLPSTVRFMDYDDEGIKERRTDPYGTGLTYVEAWELKKVDESKETPWTKAIFAMIRALPDSFPVVLMWR